MGAPSIVKRMKHVVLAILVVGIMPYVLTGASKSKGFTARENQVTRLWQSELTGWRRRAYWAHQNAFEAIPIFAALAILALLANPESVVIPYAVWAFVALRIGYAVSYLADAGRVRSTFWLVSQGSPLALA